MKRFWMELLWSEGHWCLFFASSWIRTDVAVTAGFFHVSCAWLGKCNLSRGHTNIFWHLIFIPESLGSQRSWLLEFLRRSFLMFSRITVLIIFDLCQFFDFLLVGHLGVVLQDGTWSYLDSAAFWSCGLLVDDVKELVVFVDMGIACSPSTCWLLEGIRIVINIGFPFCFWGL